MCPAPLPGVPDLLGSGMTGVIPCPKCGQPMAESLACPGARTILICLAPPTPPPPDRLERMIASKMEVCIHYRPRPGMHVECLAGIPERDIPRAPLPCVTNAPCAKKRRYTREEAIAERERRDAECKGCGHSLIGDAAVAYYRSLGR